MKHTLWESKMASGFIQGDVPAELAERWDKASERLNAKKKDMVATIAELFLRLPDTIQATATIALRNDEVFAAFMQAVDRVIAEAILARLPSIGRIPEVADLRGRIAALEERQSIRKSPSGPHRAREKRKSG